MNTDEKRRKIRSFVRREGRMTKGQQSAFETHWSEYGLSIDDGLLDFQRTFNNDHAVILEIGFGMGDSLIQMAKANPGNNYIGVEVHRPGVGALLMAIAKEGLNNIRVYCHDAVEVLNLCIHDASLSGMQIFFPDPWHKKRHHKRRIIQPAFVAMLAKKIKPGGFLHCATDWENYAHHMMDVLTASEDFKNNAAGSQFSARPEERPLTKFENRGKNLGHGVWDLVFIKS